MASAERVPHALMILGPEGNGNLLLALALAQYIQCENKQENDSCGACSSCSKNQKFVHPDLHFTFPVVPRKSGEPPISNDYITECHCRFGTIPNDYVFALIGGERPDKFLESIGISPSDSKRIGSSEFST